jgi:hypothetical protein
MTYALPIKIPFTTGLLVYGNGVPIQQLKKVNSYPQLGGDLPRGLPNGGSLRGGSINQDPHGGPPPNPHQIHLLDFMDGKCLNQGYLCYHGINQFQFYLN